jgi:hypothetical protein
VTAEVVDRVSTKNAYEKGLLMFRLDSSTGFDCSSRPAITGEVRLRVT